jgi:hypothetical protein
LSSAKWTSKCKQMPKCTIVTITSANCASCSRMLRLPSPSTNNKSTLSMHLSSRLVRAMPNLEIIYKPFRTMIIHKLHSLKVYLSSMPRSSVNSHRVFRRLLCRSPRVRRLSMQRLISSCSLKIISLITPLFSRKLSSH